MAGTETITLLRDVMIKSNTLDRYFEGNVPIDLWRAKHVKRHVDLFELVEEPYKMSRNRIRRPDITIEVRKGVKWVVVQGAPRGASTFDKRGCPPGADWAYYKIPKGTELPAGLAIVKDHFNEDWGAFHYTIAPDRDMPLDSFKRLLAELARRCTQVGEVG